MNIVTQKEFYTVYQTTNLINKKIYVGFHSTDFIEDDYYGSGKLIKRAILKYGNENFKKEILFTFDNRNEAELKEAEIVDIDFVLREDTYNLSLGGNVCILYGENNGFYGKKHTSETLAKIQASRNDTFESRGYGVLNKFHCFLDGIEYFNLTSARLHNGKNKIGKMVVAMCGDPSNDCLFVDEEMQNFACVVFEQRRLRAIEIRKLRQSQASQRFKGVPKSQHQKELMSKIMTGRYCPWVQLTNRNPEKIRKTAEKHRNIERTPDWCENIGIGRREAIKEKKQAGLWKPSTFKGFYITPHGRFTTTLDASLSSGVHIAVIYERCKVKTDNAIKRNEDKALIGKTWRELGWYFEPIQK